MGLEQTRGAIRPVHDIQERFQLVPASFGKTSRLIWFINVSLILLLPKFSFIFVANKYNIVVHVMREVWSKRICLSTKSAVSISYKYHILPNKRACLNKRTPSMFYFDWPYLKNYLINLRSTPRVS